MTDNQIIPLTLDVRGRANKYHERECPECGTVDWMSDEDEYCWRCERVKQGLPAVKPDPVHGYLFWNYQEQAWLPSRNCGKIYAPLSGANERRNRAYEQAIHRRPVHLNRVR